MCWGELRVTADVAASFTTWLIIILIAGQLTVRRGGLRHQQVDSSEIKGSSQRRLSFFRPVGASVGSVGPRWTWKTPTCSWSCCRLSLGWLCVVFLEASRTLRRLQQHGLHRAQMCRWRRRSESLLPSNYSICSTQRNILWTHRWDFSQAGAHQVVTNWVNSPFNSCFRGDVCCLVRCAGEGDSFCSKGCFHLFCAGSVWLPAGFWGRTRSGRPDLSAELFNPRDVARGRVTKSRLNVERQIYDFNEGCLPCH